VNASSYYKVCGKARGYQKSTTDAFAGGVKHINGPYIDGLSITVVSNHKHVWTYAVGLSGNFSTLTANCPCNSIAPGVPPPAFVKQHYYCESGDFGDPEFGPFYTNDPLWDGEGCEDDCYSDVAMPWFLRQFPAAAQEDFDIRICRDQPASNEDIAVALL